MAYLWEQGIKYEDICLVKLKTYLQKPFPDINFETINPGISGYNTGNQLNQLKARGLAYQPDLVIVHFVLIHCLT